METINPSHYPASRAAGVAGDYINYKLGGPHRLYEQQQVTSASKERIEGVGNKYRLEFAIKDSLNEHPQIKCTAEVLYYTNNQQSAPNVTYKLEGEPQNYTAQKDKEFYNKMKSRSEPLTGEDIPDKFGNIAPDMEPILHLAQAASGFVKWQNSAEETFYRMAIIKSVKQVISDNAALELHYIMLIHDMVSQEIIPWSMEVLWDLSEGLRVNNHQRLPKINPDETSS
ncbi:latexin [Hyla sarda]|uniref:latexin n=1 Tax=Hyla sarda TaxID=327740 RepID=UPI0024C28CAD|nr:latexin [Hyla sarda]XP_056421016.1 latexin [Hyla sarda]XP_056421017.1 latexin [Hyla sarda]